MKFIKNTLSKFEIKEENFDEDIVFFIWIWIAALIIISAIFRAYIPMI